MSSIPRPTVLVSIPTPPSSLYDDVLMWRSKTHGLFVANRLVVHQWLIARREIRTDRLRREVLEITEINFLEATRYELAIIANQLD